jgi:surfactin synthase thioesterase subunit
MNKTEGEGEDEEPKPKKPKVYRGQEFTMERMVEDLRRLITSSSQQERPLMLIGAEMGAMIARFYTQIYEE